MLSMLRKLGSEYFFFVSTFHSRRDSIPNWNIPSLDDFVESLIQDKDKLVQVGVIQSSKNQELLITDSNNAQERRKHKGKDPKAIDSNPKENQRSSNGASSSNKENTKCPYCMRGFHLESQCMKNTID